MSRSGSVSERDEVSILEKRVYDQDQLLRISKALNSELDLNSLIESVLDLCLAQVQTVQIGIYLYPELDSRKFMLHDHYIGFTVKSPTDFVISEKNSMIRYIQENGNHFKLSQLKKIAPEMDKVFQNTAQNLSLLNKNLLLIPMKNKQKINGIIVLGARSVAEPYSDNDIEFLNDLAAIAAVAVENARLYKLATVDIMTKLKVHHFFQMKLRENIEACKKHDRENFSIFLTDIDHFKKFNDTYGHQLGDLVLKEVARVLREACRDSDIPCRYGGEEFAVILPNTNILEAFASAERIRHSVEKLEVPNPSDVGDDVLKVTISIGVAEYNAAIDEEPRMLVERSDKALYKAKRAGRNQVVKSI